MAKAKAKKANDERLFKAILVLLEQATPRALKLALGMVEREIDRIDGILDKLNDLKRKIESRKFYLKTGKGFGEQIKVGKATFKIIDERTLRRVGGAERQMHASYLEEFLLGKTKTPTTHPNNHLNRG